MLKKLFWIATTVFIVMAMLLSACESTTSDTTTLVTGTTTASATTKATTAVVTPTSTTTTAATTADTNKPTYGGTITFILQHQKATDYFDPNISAIGGWLASVNYEKFASSDWGLGPNGGTGENPYTGSYMGPQWLKGQSIESWEITTPLHTVILHVRKGVHFVNKYPAFGREMNADDIVYSYNRTYKDARNGNYWFCEWTDTAGIQGWRDYYKNAGWTDAEMDDWIAKITKDKLPEFTDKYMVKVDNYTVRWETFWNNSNIPDGLTYYWAQPIEQAKVDMADWKNACGTSAYSVQDCVNASSVLWARNPDYWMKDPKYPQFQLPYSDYLRGLIIIDESTQHAAMRSHKVDMVGVSFDKVAGMQKSNPELPSKMMLPTGSVVIFMRTDIAPFNDPRVRQALSMAVDRDTILNGYFKGNAILDAWPVLPSNFDAHTNIQDMPPDVRKLFEYHPDQAKQLLADAGYPNGFKTIVNIYTSPVDNDQLQIVIDQWKTIGVEATMAIVEGATHSAILYQRTYAQMIYTWWGNASPESVFGWAHGGVPSSIYSFSGGGGTGVIDQTAVDVFQQKWSKETDYATKMKLLKEEYIRENALVWEIPLCTQAGRIFWQPYLKGYAGEINMGQGAEYGFNEMWKFMWVDKALKAKTQ